MGAEQSRAGWTGFGGRLTLSCLKMLFATILNGAAVSNRRKTIGDRYWVVGNPPLLWLRPKAAVG